MRMKVATMGDRSIIPTRVNWRRGANIGSVMSWRKVTNGLRGSRATQERITRRNIAAVRT